jgi:hypothetical protein
MTPETKQLITITAKCPKYKKTKKYTSDDPPQTTHYCPNGCLMPMFISKIDIKTVKINK